jgi:hypothetical protein
MARVSIIISTKNRAPSLRSTLASLAQAHVPTGWEVEVLLVDNGSADETAAVIDGFRPPAMAVRRLVEPMPGKARALNRAVRAARGDLLLFTDDDVRVPPDWIAGMAAPLRDGRADAVAGGVRLAPSLRPSTLTPEAAALLASTGVDLDPERPARMVGANMALHRRVFDRISGFDPELGPGRLGVEEETLLSLQLRAAEMAVVGAFEVAVEHHPCPTRRDPDVLAGAAARVGRSNAYVCYHWRHHRPSRLRSLLGATAAGLRLRLWTWAQACTKPWKEALRKEALRKEALPGLRGAASPSAASGTDAGGGLPAWRYALERRRAFHLQMLREAGRPRNYARHGLRKEGGERDPVRAPRAGPARRPPSRAPARLNTSGRA